MKSEHKKQIEFLLTESLFKEMSELTLTCLESGIRSVIDDEEATIEFVVGSNMRMKAVLVREPNRARHVDELIETRFELDNKNE